MSPGANGEDAAYDVAILGAGICGQHARGHSSLAMACGCCWSRRIVYTRFAIGESTIPETGGLVRVIGTRYSVPEIATSAIFQNRSGTT